MRAPPFTDVADIQEAEDKGCGERGLRRKVCGTTAQASDGQKQGVVHVFTADSFTVAKRREQPKCPSTDDG